MKLKVIILCVCFFERGRINDRELSEKQLGK